ncbi:MarR family winged helix-turn-helix transcriptional regulator [Streptomyces sp. NPDC048462]|uniref:MarR family winged helix-turn-helix transcriptional regulator n=1 Tax=Streptomyces sp. NPDC048462 TaxID=3365555 RepID=UPI00371D790B
MDEVTERLANVVGATALGLVDRIWQAIAEESVPNGESAAALSVIDHAAGLSIDQLRHVLALSHPATGRLVARLVTEGLVTHAQAACDRRVAVLHLTPEGKRSLSGFRQRRAEVVAQVLGAVATEDLPALQRAMDAMAGALPHNAPSALRVCRLCDQDRCIECPMTSFGTLKVVAGQSG